MKDKIWFPIIVSVSIVIPVVVFLLLNLPKAEAGDFDITILPKLNAILNSLTAVFLLLGFVFIKNKNIPFHRISMLSAFLFSSLFLVSYVIYHYFSEETKFGGTGSIRIIYFILLISHIILATVIVPLSLFTIYHAFGKAFEKHKKIARWTFPIWLYVAVSGVLVYLMLSPYYSI
jgi:putative membrane protein